VGTRLRVLIVEDSAEDAALLLRELDRGGYDVVCERVETAADMESALQRATWDLVLSDHNLPAFDSFAALDLVKAFEPDLPFIIVSGSIGEDMAVAAMKAGASDYLLKGKLARLAPAVARELSDAQQRRARRMTQQDFQEQEQRAALELAAAYESTLDGWARALDLRDHETEGHSKRVTDLTLRLATILGVGETERVHLRRGALLHDIGKIAIPDSILLKPSRLDRDEWDIMRRHPVYAVELIGRIEYLKPAIDIPYCHHEKWDGTGYPRGLKGEEIPLAARIFAPADIWDALRSARPYRPAWEADQARQHIAALSGTQLDPTVVAAFLDMLASVEDSSQSRSPAGDTSRAQVRNTILVVDDFRTNVELLRRWLVADGYAVVTADSGEAALKAATERHPDLILLDVMIPRPDGLAVCQRLKRDPMTRNTPIIVMTGVPDPRIQLSARRFGADDYLMKPIDGYELRRRIRQALSSRPAAGDPYAQP
jgi:putative two-component system response regulator